MIIKRNDFTTYLENHITKEQNQVLQSVPGFRVKYINVISLLTEMMECDYHWINNKEYKSNFHDLIPETFKEYCEHCHCLKGQDLLRGLLLTVPTQGL